MSRAFQRHLPGVEVSRRRRKGRQWKPHPKCLHLILRRPPKRNRLTQRPPVCRPAASALAPLLSLLTGSGSGGAKPPPPKSRGYSVTPNWVKWYKWSSTIKRRDKFSPIYLLRFHYNHASKYASKRISKAHLKGDSHYQKRLQRQSETAV